MLAKNVAFLLLVGVLMASCAQEEGPQCTLKRRGSIIVAVRGDCSTHNFDGLDLSNADTSRVEWGSATCPDGSNAQDHGGTCQGHLDPDRMIAPDAGPDVVRDMAEDVDIGEVDLPEEDAPTPDMPVDMPQDVPTQDSPEEVVEPDVTGPDLPAPDMTEDLPVTDMSEDMEEDMPSSSCSNFYFDDRTLVEGFHRGILDDWTTWTLDAWILPDNSDTPGGGFFSYAQPNVWPPVELTLRAQPELDTGTIEVALWTGLQFYIAYVYVADYGGDWMHVSLEVPSFALYINGLRVVVDDIEAVRVNWVESSFYNAQLFLGGTRQNGDASDFYRGYLSEVHLQRGEVHQHNFVPLRRSVIAQNTLGLWRLDEGEGATIFDSGPGFHSGVVEGEATWYPCIEE